MCQKGRRLWILVDYQNDFVCGSDGFLEAKEIEENILRKIEQVKRRGDDILVTLDTHFDERFEHKNSQKSAGWEIFGRVKAALPSEAFRMSKHSFASPDLHNFLAEGQYDTVELAGVVTHLCVLANAVAARISLPDAEIQIDAACVASPKPDLHEKALDIMEGMGFTVLNRKRSENV